MRISFTTFLFVLHLLAVSQSKPSFSPIFFAILTSNIDQSTDWYESNLGFKVVAESENEQMGLRQKNLQLDGIRLEIIELPGVVSASEILENSTDGNRIQGFFKIGFEVDGFDDLLNSLDENEVTFRGSVVQDPVTLSRMVIVLDPEGNRIQLFEK